MLGFYEGFPVNAHKIARFATLISNKKLQQALVQTVQKLNGEKSSLEEVTEPSIPACIVIFEFGIAEGDTFSYLDLAETQKVLEKIRKAPLHVMDFFCAIRYYKKQNGNKTPLKFDYYMLRLSFNTGLLEINVFHERGPRHMLPEDIVNLIVNKVNEFFSRKVLKAV